MTRAQAFPAALIVDSRLGAFPDEVPAVLPLTSTVDGEAAGLLRT